jgi:uncharacterized protein (TIGR02145 family)
MAVNPVQFRNGKIAFSLSCNTSVGISIHDVGGRQVFAAKSTFSPGTHTISVPLQSAGVFMCKVTIGNESYSLRTSSLGASSMQQAVVSRGTSTFARQAKATAVISDVIAATKTGWLNYRCVIGNSDTSGVIIKMLPNAGDVTDADGNVYQSVRIGNQVWTVENLRTTKYNDGTVIPLVTDTSAWGALITPGRCWYDNDSASNHAIYGILYNWYAVNTGKLAPTGWRVPTQADWITLNSYLRANGYNWDGSTSGDKTGKSLAAKAVWSSSSEPGNVGNDLGSNNRTGFSALPDGFRFFNGHFAHRGNYGCWWSATEYTALYAFHRYLYYELEYLFINENEKICGFSVRLVRDLD